MSTSYYGHMVKNNNDNNDIFQGPEGRKELRRPHRSGKVVQYSRCRIIDIKIFFVTNENLPKCTQKIRKVAKHIFLVLTVMAC